LVLVPNKDMETPEFSIRRVRSDELGLAENTQVSFRMPTSAETPDVGLQAKRPPAPQAAVTTIIPTAPAPSAPSAPEPAPPTPVAIAAAPRLGLFGWLKSALFGDSQPTDTDNGKVSGKHPAHDERKGRDERARGGRDHERDARRGRDGRDGDRQRGGRNRGRDGERRPPRSESEAARSEQRSGEHKPRRDQPPVKHPEISAATPAAAATGASDNVAMRTDSEKRSRRGGRRRRGRGGRGGEGAAVSGIAGSAGGLAIDNGSDSHSEVPGPQPALDFSDSRPIAAPRKEAPPPAPPAPEVRAVLPPPPERPTVVWSSSASSVALGSADRSQREE
jgi:ribonuclease E